MLTSSNIKASSKCLFYQRAMLAVQILHLLFELLWKRAKFERRSAHQLRLKDAEMLQSSTQLAKNHGDDLGLECLWKGHEQGKQFDAMEKSAEHGGQPEILALVHVIERLITVL